jgi:transcription elongation factor GreA
MESAMVVTRDGYDQLQQELEHLKSVHRKEVAERIRDSKQFGEFLESSEYEEAKSEQAVVEGRILELERVLQNVVVVEDPSTNGDKVGVGSVVVLRDMKAGREAEYTVVGPIEADPTKRRISYQSPLGAAIVGHREDDKVEAKAPTGNVTYLVVQVKNKK